MKRIIVIGATSGIGFEVASIYINRGWTVGVAGRRVERLESLRLMAPERVKVARIDVTAPTAQEHLLGLANELGGMDVLFLSSGIGRQNRTLDLAIETQTGATNVQGFMQIIHAGYHYFRQQGHGHIAAISSIAGTKGLGSAPAYSATKAFQNCYLQALEQLIRMEKLNIRVTDIRPGFVSTDLLKGGNYPLLMQSERVAQSIVRAMDRKRRIRIIDWRYRFIVFFWQLIPAWLWVRLPVANKKKEE